MARTKAFATVLILTAGVLAHAQRGPVPSDAPLALVHANVVNVRDGGVRQNATIVLRSGRIESVGEGPPPAGVTVLDLKGKFVLPGLIDAHTHADNFAAFRRALESGVTTMRSAGVSNYADVGFHELVKKGAAVGPDIVPAGYHVRPVLAPEAFLNNPEYSDLMSGVTTIEKMRRAVDMNLAHGVRWIKILATERAGTADTDPRKQVYTEDEIRAIVQEAATKGIPVEAHAHGDEGAMAAVRAGVRSIEHGTYLSDATLR
ncbi:MAG: amidohydrolase family protein, partial [Betaproteobacteria bacterium]